MNLLFIGDIFGSPGRRIVADHLEDIRTTKAIDLVIANAENAAGGFGLTPSIAQDLFALGIDVLTTGSRVCCGRRTIRRRRAAARWWCTAGRAFLAR